MNSIKNIIITLALGLLATGAMARTLEIKMSQCPKPYVDNLRKMTASLRNTDELIIDFDKSGKYEFDGSLKLRCNTTIKGLSPASTKVIVKEGFAGGKSKMQDGSFIAVHGTSNNKVKVTIKDIGFELASHKGILWEDSPKHIVKIVDADGVLIDNIVTQTKNAVLTNLDLRQCSNVVVQNSEFENYNNCDDGGCLWSRGEQKNIIIRNNVFRKYGKDEVLGCWGGVYSKDFEIKNIIVENNEFYLDNKTGCNPLDVSNFITFSHAYGEGAKTHCVLDSIFFRDNKITLNAPIKRIIVIDLCKLAKLNQIEITGNEILCTPKSSSVNSFMNDVEVMAETFESVNIFLTDNHITTQNEIKGDSGHTFLSVRNANIKVANNTINNDYPQRLAWCHEGSMRLKLENNSVTNMYTTTLSSSKSIDNVWITAINNSLSGDTRIYCKNVKNLDLIYKNNVFNSTDYHFFLQEGAEQASITFEGNTVNAKSGKGIMFANYSKKPYNFTKLQVTNNTFRGLSRNAIEDSFKNARNKTINNNIYR